MDLNSDFAKRVLVHSGELPWEPSPMAGVDRRRLDRVGSDAPDERVTTIVRYAPGSHFSPHVHVGGEEFLVLEGVFEDEHGEYPVGSYVRNPPQSRHTPGAEQGCVILVKLCQFDPADRTSVRIDTNKMQWIPHRERAGVSVLPLFYDRREDVRLERWAANQKLELDTSGGAELLLLSGTATESKQLLKPCSWLRLPDQRQSEFQVGADGATLWIKSGHLSG